MKKQKIVEQIEEKLAAFSPGCHMYGCSTTALDTEVLICLYYLCKNKPEDYIRLSNCYKVFSKKDFLIEVREYASSECKE